MRKSIVILLSIAAVLAFCVSGCKSYKNAMAEESYQDSIASIVARQVIDEQTFLLKGDRLTIKNYNFPYVNSSTNFIMIDGNKGIVQVSPAFSGGPNGVGGFTVDGTVSKYEVNHKKSGQVRISFHLSAPIGSCDVQITVYKHSAQCFASINSTFRSGRATLYGSIIPNDDSVYKGRSPF